MISQCPFCDQELTKSGTPVSDFGYSYVCANGLCFVLQDHSSFGYFAVEDKITCYQISIMKISENDEIFAYQLVALSKESYSRTSIYKQKLNSNLAILSDQGLI